MGTGPQERLNFAWIMDVDADYLVWVGSAVSSLGWEATVSTLRRESTIPTLWREAAVSSLWREAAVPSLGWEATKPSLGRESAHGRHHSRSHAPA